MPPISRWDPVVRELQHETGLPDDSFYERDGYLVVRGTGYGGDVTRREQEGLERVASQRNLDVLYRDGKAVVSGPGEAASAPTDLFAGLF